SFPPPRIDILVDSTSGCEMLSFLDAYQGYNQIPLAPEDQEKASFVTDQGVFCYNVFFGKRDLSITCFKIRLAETWSDCGKEVKALLPISPSNRFDEPSFETALSEPKLSGRMVKWAVELSEYGIEFHPRPAIKAQVLADFVVELAYDEASISTPTWSLYVDGSSTSTGSGAGVALESPQGDKFEYAIKLDFPSSNNEAEYEAFLAGARDEKMAKYFSKAKNMLGKFEEASVVQVSRANNATADQLAKLASSMAAIRSRKITFISSERAAIEDRKRKGGDQVPLEEHRVPFGIPRAIISDNGTQFSGNKLKEWCKGLAIKQFFTSVSNPQANGQTEVTNRTILQHLKTRLGTAKGAWVDELPSVLWAYRTTPRTTTGETPFSLSYGTDAVAPAEVGELNWRVKHYDLEANEQG
ncbi:UNVERIFIED_CONTAM: hypothetical protein Scaly_0091300, partial [Sesamum calycinum]